MHALSGGSALIIAGELDGTRGPASTFTPIKLSDGSLCITGEHRIREG
jgi:hypothetical protein